MSAARNFVSAQTAVSDEIARKIDGMKLKVPNAKGQMKDVKVLVDDDNVPYVVYGNNHEVTDKKMVAAAEREVAAFLNKNKASSSKGVEVEVVHAAKRQHPEEEEEGDEMEEEDFEDEGSLEGSYESEEEVPKAKGTKAGSISIDSFKNVSKSSAKQMGHFDPKLLAVLKTKKKMAFGKNEYNALVLPFSCNGKAMEAELGMKNTPKKSRGFRYGNSKEITDGNVIKAIVLALRKLGYKGSVPFATAGSEPRYYH